MRCSTLPAWVFAALVVLVLHAPLVSAQGKVSPCPDQDRSRRPSHCEIREFQVPVSGDSLEVNATPNGGISVRGWERNEIQLRARVTANAETQQDADALAADVRVLTDGGRIRSEGRRNQDGGWSVSFELMVPARHNLELTTTNGGISVKDVQSRMAFSTTNGGITLNNVNGDVRGRTNNGGVTVELAGGTWLGEGLDVETHNGGVRLAVPAGYSAHLDVGTTNGGVNSDIPLTVQGNIGKQLSVDLGSGGPLLKLKTINGGVSIQQRR
jgi:DUF4097 and DUF4098 domain-containing protein YvlB